MKPVMSRRTMPPGHRGDCLSACLASLLELDIEDVPLFDREPAGGWPYKVDEFTRKHGYAFVGFAVTHEYTPPPACYHICVGPSQNNPAVPGTHAVIAWENMPVHDPNTGGMFIDEIESRWLLVPLQARGDEKPVPFRRYVWWRDWTFMTALCIAIGLLIASAIIVCTKT
jgi:hypothetical protein